VALLAALTMVFVGCGGSDDPDPGTGNGSDGWTHNLGGFNFTMADNFEWSTGYQGLIQQASLFAGNRVRIGDEYTLKITFTASRDFTDELYVGLVDPVARGSWADGTDTYWHPLSWPGDPVDPELVAGAAADNIIKAGEVVTAEITMTAIADAASAAAAANSIVFMTDCAQGTGGTAGSGVLGPIVLTFTEFIFMKGDGGSEPPPPPPPPPASATLADFLTVTGLDIAGLDTEISEGMFTRPTGPLTNNGGATAMEWVSHEDGLSLKVSGVNWHGLVISTTGLQLTDTITVTGRAVITAPTDGANREILINSDEWGPGDAGTRWFMDHLGDGTHPFTLTGNISQAWLDAVMRVQTNNAGDTIPHFFIDNITITRP